MGSALVLTCYSPCFVFCIKRLLCPFVILIHVRLIEDVIYDIRLIQDVHDVRTRRLSDSRLAAMYV